MPKVSVIICVYNEEDNIKPLVNKLFEALTGMDYEIIYVDDGSTDNTAKEVMAINSRRIKLIRFRTNYGQSSALAAGIDNAEGDYIVTMDGDLQNDPADIPMMIRLAEEGGWGLVAGARKNRKDGFLLRKIPSKIANAMIRKTTGVMIRDYGCTLKVFKSDIAKNIGLYGELHRFIPVLASFEGATITQVDVQHHPRIHGTSKYGINRTMKVLSDLLLLLFFKKYFQKPMHLFGSLGVIIFLAGVFIDFYLLILKVLGNDIWGKPLLLLGIMLTIAGIQIITVGIILEVLTRTYFESQDKKRYSIKSIHIGEK